MTSLINRARALAVFASAVIAAAASVAPAAAFDIEASAYFGNLGLPWDGETAMTDAEFPADGWLYGGRAAFVQRLGDGFSLVAEYETDPVLRNIVRGVITYKTGMASISAGPMVGVFNSAGHALKAGIDIGFRLEAPGIAFFSADVESSMGAGLVTAGDYSQEASELSAGWYVYNAICSASLISKRFTRIIDAGALVDASTDYLFSVDVHKKGTPYRVLTELGYRTMTRTYPDDTIDGLGAVILGAEVNADVSPTLTVVAGLDSGVYVFGLEELSGRGPASSSFLFSASVGFVLHLGDKPTAEPPALE
ncbi:MAG: hypothetical protein CVV47_11880 [Spirochaetae bacterium HGW-Spirochaetae-3]|jgi:hypothetical protein|nr:MAG: hypothetical protein CVV47_11880 [Spirochaetae bacterium HGW-Spirochaetae-3]